MFATELPERAQRWELYRVLGEPFRLRLLALVAAEELAVGELADLLAESQPNVSRHLASLKQAGLVALRKEGTRSLVSFRDGGDPVVNDALVSGRALCDSDGSFARLAEVVRSRDLAAREFFERPRVKDPSGPPAELGAYLCALGWLLPGRALAVDAGTGDGGLLDVLAPVFEHVVAIDRSRAQLAVARARVKQRGYHNVTLVHGDLDGTEALACAGGRADAVFAARLLHHAPKPAVVMRKLAELCAPGGALIVLDYARHDDEQMREQADIWLGFSPAELVKLAVDTGFEGARTAKLSGALTGNGPDAHLPWQVLVARRAAVSSLKKNKERHHG